MLRRLLWCALVSLVLAPTALAGGPSPGVTQGSEGVRLPEGDVSYVVKAAGASTTLFAVRETDGQTLLKRSLSATWGIPLVTFDGTTGGLSYDGGYPFIHALDTVRGTAHCIGVPWRANQDGLARLRLTLVGRELRLGWPGGKTFIAVDTQTYRLSHPATAGTGGDFPWWAIAIG